MRAYEGLEKDTLLPSLDIPVTFIYGDKDWMRFDIGGAERILAKRESMCLPTEIFTVENSDHHLYMDNPEAFAAKIIEVFTRSEV